jgi:uncharacterized protein YbjT (DUF2867 family)
MALRVIVTGATGMVGEGVLHECLHHEAVAEVLVIGRRPCEVQHPKLKEIVHKDFQDLSPVADQLKGYDACYFCLGVSSIGMKEPEYAKLTYELTLNAAKIMVQQSPGMVFCYISGAGTDSSEKGRSMWARVKGKTENDLMKLPFKRAYMFRPGYMQPTKGLRRTLKPYKYLSWLYPVFRLLFPSGTSTLAAVGQAMINVTLRPEEKSILEVRDIIRISKG